MRLAPENHSVPIRTNVYSTLWMVFVPPLSSRLQPVRPRAVRIETAASRIADRDIQYTSTAVARSCFLINRAQRSMYLENLHVST